MANLCTDCKLSCHINGVPSTCTALRAERQDLVTGQMIEEGVYSCDYMRSDFALDKIFGGGKCGNTGKLFEAREEEAA